MHVGERSESNWGKMTGEPRRGTWIPTLQKPPAAPELQGFNFSSGQCTTLFYTLLVAASKRGVGLAVEGVQALVCTMGTGPSRYTPSPVMYNPFPCWSIWASRTLQLAQGHHNRTVPWHVSTQLPTLLSIQLLVQGVKLWYHSDNFMSLC